MEPAGTQQVPAARARRHYHRHHQHIRGQVNLLLVGMTADPDDTALMVAEFPGIRYMADYGLNQGAVLTPHGTGKWLHLPPNAVMHVSWKGNPEQVGPWL